MTDISASCNYCMPGWSAHGVGISIPDSPCFNKINSLLLGIFKNLHTCSTCKCFREWPRKKFKRRVCRTNKRIISNLCYISQINIKSTFLPDSVSITVVTAARVSSRSASGSNTTNVSFSCIIEGLYYQRGFLQTVAA